MLADNYSVLLHIILTFAYSSPPLLEGRQLKINSRDGFYHQSSHPVHQAGPAAKYCQQWWKLGDILMKPPFFPFWAGSVLSIGFWHNLNRFLNLNYQPNYDELDSLMTNGFTYLLIPSLKYFHSIMLVWLVGSGWVWLGRARIIFNNDQTIIDLLHSQVCVEPHTKLC